MAVVSGEEVMTLLRFGVFDILGHGGIAFLLVIPAQAGMTR
jgi:hypothetical protein